MGYTCRAVISSKLKYNWPVLIPHQNLEDVTLSSCSFRARDHQKPVLKNTQKE